MTHQQRRQVVQKVSNIFNSKELLDTQAYKELSPVMKDVIGDLTNKEYKDTNFVADFEANVDVLSNKYNVDRQDVYDYIERETNNI